MKHGLPPIAPPCARVLILGSLPGDKSIEMQEYYAHPQNQFWRMLAAVWGETVPVTYDERLAMLLRHRVALWDVVARAEREGSLDARIQHAVANDLTTFCRAHKALRRVLLNGETAARLYHKHFPELTLPTVTLPSTSPARANLTFEQKLVHWRAAFAGLEV